jgi:glycosyltransferase involved in cell wall biosynthesis
VVTETTGAAAWVKSTGGGSVVPPGDPVALAAGIRLCLSGPASGLDNRSLMEELSVARAAEDWIREVSEALARG